MPERLSFQVPEFLRVAWVSEPAREYWEPKIRAIDQAWSLMERTTVLHGLRPGALQSVTPERLVEIQQWSLLMDVPMVIVGMEGVGGAGNASVSYQGGKPFQYRVYLGNDPRRFFQVWRANDHAGIAQALGFPECCAWFFHHYWVIEGWRDLTYPALKPDVWKPTHSNVLLRWLGVRSVFHLPCSFTCEATRAIGEQIAELMNQSHPQETAWANTLLSMPMEWTSLHGIATVVTPIFKLVYASDPLPYLVRLRVQSDTYPEHGARSHQFPFQVTAPLRLVRPRHLNGFSSLAAMARGHQFIVDALPALTGEVVDLGCGDGTLMRAIQQKCPEATVQGVEVQADLGMDDSRIVVADLFAWPWGGHYQCVLLAMQRLLEVPRVAAVELLAAIREHTAMLLLYSYDGPHPEIDPLLAPFSIAASHFDGTHAAFLLE